MVMWFLIAVTVFVVVLLLWLLINLDEHSLRIAK
jgi:hypothetical protein